MTRSTDSRRARNSASVSTGVRRRAWSRPSRRRCFFASSRVEPDTPVTTSSLAGRASRTLTTVSGGSSGDGVGGVSLGAATATAPTAAARAWSWCRRPRRTGRRSASRSRRVRPRRRSPGRRLPHPPTQLPSCCWSATATSTGSTGCWSPAPRFPQLCRRRLTPPSASVGSDVAGSRPRHRHRRRRSTACDRDHGSPGDDVATSSEVGWSPELSEASSAVWRSSSDESGSASCGAESRWVSLVLEDLDRLRLRLERVLVDLAGSSSASATAAVVGDVSVAASGAPAGREAERLRVRRLVEADVGPSPTCSGALGAEAAEPERRRRPRPGQSWAWTGSPRLAPTETSRARTTPSSRSLRAPSGTP